jgi:molecular chaperone DnaK
VLLDHIASEFRKTQGIDLRNDLMALQRLREAAEKAKCELSTKTATDINLPFITADQSGPKHMQMEITRARLEQLLDPVIERCRKPCELALKDANLTATQVDEVVLVGGSTRMPRVQALVKEIFRREPNRSVNPDEVVGLGAAIQGGILQGESSLKDVLLLDVTPLSLGIETRGGIMTKLIERNTTIPTTKKEVFSTASDNQPAVDIKVYQGERELAQYNRLLGHFVLDGIPPAPMGVPQIEVEFSIDANGILNVAAKDLGTKKEKSIRIESSSGLSKEEVDKMRQDAEKHAEEDKKKKDLVDLKNQTDQAIYQTERLLNDNAATIADKDRTRLNAILDRLKSARDKEDAEGMKSIGAELNRAAQEVGKAIYEQAARKEGAAQEGDAGESQGASTGAGASRQGSSGGKGDDDVIDADYEVKN